MASQHRVRGRLHQALRRRLRSVFALIALRWSMHAIGTLIEFGATTPVLRVQKAWFGAAVPIGCALIVLRSLQRLASDVADWRAGRDAFAGKAMFDE